MRQPKEMGKIAQKSLDQAELSERVVPLSHRHSGSSLPG